MTQPQPKKERRRNSSGLSMTTSNHRRRPTMPLLLRLPAAAAGAILILSLIAGSVDAFALGASRTTTRRALFGDRLSTPSLFTPDQRWQQRRGAGGRSHHLTPASLSTRSSGVSAASSKDNNQQPATALDASPSQQLQQQPHRGLEPPFKVTLEGDDYSYRDAIQRTIIWVGAATVFGLGMWSVYGPTTGEEFFAGYLVEQSLSIDNLFVFLLLFDYFKVPLQYQDRVLNWGIYGAIVMRAVMIGLGAAAIQNFHAVLLVFAAILVYSSGKFFVGRDDDEDEDPGENAIVKFSRGLFPSTDGFDGDRFFTLVDGVRMATPLFICMVAVEVSDVVFAVDSIPAVFGVTENPFVVFSSNMFAIMGLRSLYTILSKAATDLKYLEPAVAIVLGFIGVKMVLEYFGFCIPTNVALGVVASFLSIGVGASVVDKRQQEQLAATATTGEVEE